MLNFGSYFRSLNPVVKEQYKENLTGDNGPYIVTERQGTMFTMLPRVWSAMEFELILLLNC